MRATLTAYPKSAVLGLVLAWLCYAAATLPAFAQPFDPPRGEVRFVVFNDLNSAYGSTSYIPAVHRTVHTITTLWKPDLVLGAGDLIAGQSQLLPDERFAEMWAAFDRYIASPLREAAIPYAFAMGNHDASSLRRPNGSYLFAREREAARRYWNQPMYEANLAYHERSDFPFHYSFRHGDVFVAVWDASSALISEGQRQWLAQELSSPAARSARLRLVMGHLPLFGVAEGRNLPGEVLADGDALRLLMERHGVHMYISGHHHAYYPGRRGELLLLNTGGVGPRRLLGQRLPPKTTVTVMDVWLEPVTFRLTTFDIASWQTITLSDLPERVEGFGGGIVRYDLVD